MDIGGALGYALVILLLVFVVGTTAYWVTYFTGGGTQVTNEVWYTKFEDAFPVADGWAALASLLAVFYILRGDSLKGPFFLAASGASILFLAFMDITFNFENGLYSLVPTNGAMQVELVINVFTAFLGVFALAAGLVFL
ncbi:MAG: hypothetical protein LYZ69_02035 [Nitrososphaerales archaeon]|nr:hypothetical protein [Nitrososphaerales archaeon]